MFSFHRHKSCCERNLHKFISLNFQIYRTSRCSTETSTNRCVWSCHICETSIRITKALAFFQVPTALINIVRKRFCQSLIELFIFEVFDLTTWGLTENTCFCCDAKFIYVGKSLWKKNKSWFVVSEFRKETVPIDWVYYNCSIFDVSACFSIILFVNEIQLEYQPESSHNEKLEHLGEFPLSLFVWADCF